MHWLAKANNFRCGFGAVSWLDGSKLVCLFTGPNKLDASNDSLSPNANWFFAKSVVFFGTSKVNTKHVKYPNYV